MVAKTLTKKRKAVLLCAIPLLKENKETKKEEYGAVDAEKMRTV